MGLRKDSRPMISLLKGTAVSYMFALLLTFVTADYRLPLHSIWILFASFGVDRLIQNCQTSRYEDLKKAAVLFALFFIFCNYQTHLKKERYDSFLKKRHDTILTTQETKEASPAARVTAKPAPNRSAVLV